MTADAGRITVCRDAASLERTLAPLRAAGASVAFVPTMGALHEGHRSLVEHAATLAAVVVVSIFVNPTQFDVADDLARYPRDLASDLALLASIGTLDPAVLVVYAPDVADVYPDGPVADLHIGEVTERLCGASRPGHFDGVATVVDALLRRVRPDVAVFGRKDHQQVVVVSHLVASQGHAVRIDAAPTVRDADGIAVSSRNQQLDDAGRAQARSIPRALARAVRDVRQARAQGDDIDPAALVAATRSGLDVHDVDYVELVDAERITALSARLDPHARALLAIAAHVDGRSGPVRLIDNVLLGDLDDEDRLLAAVDAT
jgi:pantoate--beta-alanine ligase